MDEGAWAVVIGESCYRAIAGAGATLEACQDFFAAGLLLELVLPFWVELFGFDSFFTLGQGFLSQMIHQDEGGTM